MPPELASLSWPLGHSLLSPAQSSPTSQEKAGCTARIINSTLMGSLAKGFLRKFAEILRKVRGNLQKIRFIVSGKGAELLRKVAEISQKVAENVLQ